LKNYLPTRELTLTNLKFRIEGISYESYADMLELINSKTADYVHKRSKQLCKQLK